VNSSSDGQHEERPSDYRGRGNFYEKGHSYESRGRGRGRGRGQQNQEQRRHFTHYEPRGRGQPTHYVPRGRGQNTHYEPRGRGQSIHYEPRGRGQNTHYEPRGRGQSNHYEPRGRGQSTHYEPRGRGHSTHYEPRGRGRGRGRGWQQTQNGFKPRTQDQPESPVCYNNRFDPISFYKEQKMLKKKRQQHKPFIMENNKIKISRFSGLPNKSPTEQEFTTAIIENTLKCFNEPPTKRIRSFVEKINKFSHADLKKMNIHAKLEMPSVVYVVLHVPSMSCYVGETEKSVKKRASEHFYARFSGGTGLSDKFLLDDNAKHYLIAPLWIEKDSEIRKKKETSFISIFHASLNQKQIFASKEVLKRPANHRLAQRLRQQKLLSQQDLEELTSRLSTDKPKEKLPERCFTYTYCHPALSVRVVKSVLLKYASEISQDKVFITARQSYSETLGQMLFNFADVSKEQDEDTLTKKQRTENTETGCVCGSLSNCTNPLFQGHICGFAKDIFKNDEFKAKYKNCERFSSLCEGGASLRISLPTRSVKKILHKELEKFTDYNKDLTTKIFDDLCEKIENFDKNHSHDIPPLTENEEHCIKDLRKHFVFTVVDKASKTIAITCKHFYLSSVRRQLSGYTVLTQDDKMRKLSNVKTEGAIPYAYIIPKFHKGKEAWRLIVGSPKTGNYLSEISKTFSSLLNGILYTLQQENAEYREKNGYPHFFVIRDLSSISTNLSQLSIEGSQLTTTDFSSMYQSLSKEKILDTVTSSLLFAFRYIATKLGKPIEQIRLSFNKFDREVHWSSEKTNDNHCIDEMIQFLQTIIHSSMFEFRGTFFEESGLTTGGECSGELANICLADVERKKIDGIIEEKHQLKLFFSSKQSFFFRYVDDALLTDNIRRFLPTPEEYGLSYSDSQSGTSVHWGVSLSTLYHFRLLCLTNNKFCRSQ